MMIRISSVSNIDYHNFNVSFKSHVNATASISRNDADKNITSKYLDNLALMNVSKVNKVKNNKSNNVLPYKNNLRSMIHNNESVMIAIVPRIFNAQDLNGDDRISIKSGERVGTCVEKCIYAL